MTVVSDATAITTLLKAGEEQLLKTLFGKVIVSQAVQDELLAFHPQLPDFVLLRPMTGKYPVPETETLGRGEAEAITLAFELSADLLLTDDRKARQTAERLGLKCSGLLGLLVRAKDLGKIASVKSKIEMLQSRGGLYLSEEVIAEALKLAGE
jgi:predicted nucleic acid-binding protein